MDVSLIRQHKLAAARLLTCCKLVLLGAWPSRNPTNSGGSLLLNANSRRERLIVIKSTCWSLAAAVPLLMQTESTPA